MRVSGEGYRDWSRIPLLQDLKLFKQMFVAEHANGVAFRPAPEGAFPNYDWVRSHMLLFAIPASPCPRLMDEQVAAVLKVAGQLRALRALERKETRA